MSDEYVCTKCRRLLRYSFLRAIGCLLLGGHQWRAIGTGRRDGYFGVKHETLHEACPRCGSSRWRDGYADQCHWL